MTKTIQFKISLDGSRPEIWRRVLVSADISVFELHHVFQLAMGWTNSHLYEFKLYDNVYGTRYDENDEFYDENFIDASDVSLDDLELEPRQTFLYWYDFGDSWEHTVTVEKVESIKSSPKYATCLDGAQKCPPEDVGGIHGYYNMLEVLKKKNHPEKKEFLTWLGGPFDPTQFDKDLVNKQLKKFDNYIAESMN